MTRRYLLVCLTCVLLAPFRADALELSALHLPMTRSEADASLSKDYEFSVMQDVSIRRTWEDGERVISIDFTPTNDKAVLILINYNTPVSTEAIEADAAALAGGELGEWRKAKAAKMAEIGLGATAQFARTEKGGFIFREQSGKGKYSRLAYFASTPKKNRIALAEYDIDGSTTAMGTAQGGEGATYLVKDEERRRSTGGSRESAKATAAPTVTVTTTTTKPATSTPRATTPSPVATSTPEDEETLAAEETAPAKADAASTPAGPQSWLDSLTPVHFAIAGGILLLLIIMRMNAARNAAKRRAAIAASIITGTAPAPRKPRR